MDDPLLTSSSTPKPRFNAQDVFFAVLIAALLMMICFRLDDLVGAVGLKWFYGFAAYAVALLLIAFDIGLWLDFKINKTLLLVIGLAVAASIITNAIWIALGALYLTGRFAGFFFYFIPPTLYCVILLGVVLIWPVLQIMSVQIITQRSMKVLASLILAFALLQIISTGAPFAMLESISYQNHHYFILVYRQVMGDPQPATVYQCNQRGLFCTRIYESSYSEFVERAKLVVDPQKNEIGVEVNGRLVHTFTPEQPSVN